MKTISVLPDSGRPAPHSIFRSEHQPTATAPAATAPQVAFSGGLYNLQTNTTNVLLKTFSALQHYFWAFLAFDVVALWITRIGKGLFRGALPYDVNQEPNKDSMTPSQLYWAQLKGTVNGLNWANAREEAMREGLTGPGALLLPTVAFAYATAKTRSSAIRMSYPELNRFTSTYMAHLAQSTPTGDEAQFVENFAQFLKNRFAPDDNVTKAMRDTRLSTLGIALESPTGGAYNASKTIGQYIDDWATAWAQKAFEGISGSPQVPNSTLEKMNARLSKVLVGYNQTFLPNGLNNSSVILKMTGGKMNRHAVDTLFETLSKAGSRAPVSTTGLQNLDGFLTNLTYFKDFARQVAEKTLKTGAEAGKSEWLKNAYSLFRKSTAHKGLFAFVATMLSGFYLYYLPRLVQSEGHYPANRLYQAGGTDAAKSQAEQKKAEKHLGRFTHPVQPAQPKQNLRGVPQDDRLLHPAATGGLIQTPFDAATLSPISAEPFAVPQPRTSVAESAWGTHPPFIPNPQRFPSTPFPPDLMGAWNHPYTTPPGALYKPSVGIGSMPYPPYSYTTAPYPTSAFVGQGVRYE